MLAVNFGDLDDGNIEGTAAEVIHGDFRVTGFFIHAIGQRRRRRFIDDAFYLKTGNAAGVFGGLAL